MFSSLSQVKAQIFSLPFLIMLTITLEVGSADVLLPALNVMKSYYHVSDQAIEWLITVNLLGLGISSVIYGAASDYFGRRLVYLFGVFLFTLAAIKLCFAQTYYELLCWRFIQGLGGGVCATIGLAMLKDHYNSETYTQILSWIGPVITASPVFYPMLGAYLLTFGFQSLFILTASLAMILFILLLIYLPETSARRTIQMGQLVRAYGFIIKNGRFMSYSAICGITYAAIWLYIALFSLLAVQKYGFKPQDLFFLLAISVLASILGSYAQVKLVQRYPIQHCLWVGILLAGLAALGMCLILVTKDSVYILIGFASLYWFSNAIVFTNASDLALSLIPENLGIAASFLTTSELICSALAVFIGAQFYDQTATTIVVTTLFCSFMMLILLFYARRS